MSTTDNEKYPFYEYIMEDKSHYPHAKDKGFIDVDDDFLIGDSGGFLLNIIPGSKFVNTHLLTEMADYYREHKCYTKYKVDSIPHTQLRKREQHRRKHGFTAPCLRLPDGTIKNIRITGSHYNFLNYTLMEQLDESSIKEGAGGAKAEKHYDFSKFIDAQYWTFKIMEFVVNNAFHLIIDKTRRGGFSYIMASDSANMLNCYKRKVCIHVANLSNYLTDEGGLTSFAINNMNFYEDQTPFVRGVVSPTKTEFKLGIRQKDGREHPKSWKSTLLSVSANSNPNCAIGKDAKIVKVEEVSTMDNFDEFMNVTEPAMRTGAYTTGCLMCWGTATAGNMQTFEQNFNNPRAHNFMPFENVWDKDSRNEVCGYFKPYCWGLQGSINGRKAMDENGNSNILIGLEISEKERADKKLKVKTYGEYLNYLGQYANMPCESFSSTSENIFSSEELTAWENELRTDSKYKFGIDGQLVKVKDKLVFKSNERLIAEGGKLNRDVFEWIQGVPRKGHENPHGCIRRWFAPQKIKYVNKAGQLVEDIPVGLYSITYDPVGINKDKKEITSKHSHNSIRVWMNPHECNGFKQKVVAAYYGRPDKLEEADEICYKLAVYYNCIGTVAVEVDRGETISNFTKWKALQYLEKEPIVVWDSSIKTKQDSHYGYIIGDGIKKLNGIRLLKEMLYETVCQDEQGNNVSMYRYIYDYQAILELKKWNTMGNFDRVSEMILRGIQWAAMDIKAKKELAHRKKIEANRDTNNTPILKRAWF
jgi:hypothetical protein